MIPLMTTMPSSLSEPQNVLYRDEPKTSTSLEQTDTASRETASDITRVLGDTEDTDGSASGESDSSSFDDTALTGEDSSNDDDDDGGDEGDTEEDLEPEDDTSDEGGLEDDGGRDENTQTTATTSDDSHKGDESTPDDNHMRSSHTIETTKGNSTGTDTDTDTVDCHIKTLQNALENLEGHTQTIETNPKLQHEDMVTLDLRLSNLHSKLEAACKHLNGKYDPELNRCQAQVTKKMMEVVKAVVKKEPVDQRTSDKQLAFAQAAPAFAYSDADMHRQIHAPLAARLFSVRFRPSAIMQVTTTSAPDQWSTCENRSCACQHCKGCVHLCRCQTQAKASSSPTRAQKRSTRRKRPKSDVTEHTTNRKRLPKGGTRALMIASRRKGHVQPKKRRTKQSRHTGHTTRTKTPNTERTKKHTTDSTSITTRSK
jgi:hypothetical protein